VNADQDGCAGVAAAESDVVQAAVVPHGVPAVDVDSVVPDAVVAVDQRKAGGGDLGAGGVGLGRGAPVQGAVRSDGVVVGAEGVELDLELGECVGGGLVAQPLLPGLVEAFDPARRPRLGTFRGARAEPLRRRDAWRVQRSPTLTSVLLRVLDRTSSDRTTTYRPHTPLVGPEPPGADPVAAAVPEQLETVDVEPAGTVPVGHTAPPRGTTAAAPVPRSEGGGPEVQVAPRGRRAPSWTC
jgi:hypothetical protein